MKYWARTTFPMAAPTALQTARIGVDQRGLGLPAKADGVERCRIHRSRYAAVAPDRHQTRRKGELAGAHTRHSSGHFNPRRARRNKPERSGTRQIISDEFHSHGSFTNRGRNAVHCACAYISSCENAWDAGLQQHRFAALLPHFGKPVCQGHITSGENKSFAVPKNCRRQPAAMRARTDKNEHGVGRLDDDRVVFE